MKRRHSVGAERRKHVRVPLNLLIQYRVESFEAFLNEYAADLSEGGMFLKSKQPRSEGTLLYLQFALRDGTRLIEGLGRVVHTQAEGPQTGMGVEFVNFDEASQQLIRAIVAERLSSSRAPED